ncbi:MAG: low molecular weight phosphotyrosine protein phosphatase [Duodenibacillus sp.]|nr:low molecular weight phosphotyrosine protein phosphatase [Duodenibacillus sp.]
MIRILFVCLGNICRSPTAEGVMRTLVKARNLDGQIALDSAGTGDWHVGQAPDRRAQAACRRAEVDISMHRARQVCREDFSRFDLILACDRENLRDLQRMSPAGAAARIRMLRDYDASAPGEDVPDPYYGSAEDFDETVRICRTACEGLLAQILDKRGETH